MDSGKEYAKAFADYGAGRQERSQPESVVYINYVREENRYK